MQRAADLVEKITQVFVGVVAAFLGLRFFLRLFNANPANDFVSWLYNVSDRLLEPFRGVFPMQEIEPGFVVEFSTLFAMVIYALIGFLILALVDVLRPAETKVTSTSKSSKSK